MGRNLLIIFLILLFSIAATYHTVQRNGFFFFEKEKFHEYQSGWGNQYERHVRILEGNSYFYNPWQYRILSAYLAEVFVKIFRLSGIKYEYFWGFSTFRTVLNIILFSLFYKYASTINKNVYSNLAIMSLSFYFIIHSDFDSDFNFSTIIDVILYLLTLYVLQAQKNSFWILPIIILGALNRETSIFIPLIFILWNLDFKISRNYLVISEKRNLTLVLFVSSFLLFWIIFGGLRIIYEYRSPLIEPSVELLWRNLRFFDHITEIDSRNIYYQTFFTGIFIVLVVGSGLQKLHKEKRIIFLSIVPTWIMLHLFLGRLIEARLLLVPIVSISLPFLAEIIARIDNNALEPLT